MGTRRRMSGSFKRGSLKSSTSGSQKVSELRGGPWVAGPAISERWAVAPGGRRPPGAVAGRHRASRLLTSRIGTPSWEKAALSFPATVPHLSPGCSRLLPENV